MALEIPANLKSNLRNCQISSIDKVDEYIRSRSKGSCLISLPTGAGKTGVISIVANLISKKNILVITHRRAVCDQLYKNLKGVFFEKIQEGLAETLVTKNVFNGLEYEDSEGIFCTTFQTLDRVDENFLKKLRDKIDLIIIDEGHAEPSAKWSLLVRSFKKSKKIIITATPYRNDLFNFDIDINHNFIYTFKSGVEDGIIYRPSFESVNSDGLIERISEIFENYPEAKCIVKCKDFQSIRNYFTFFKNTFSTMAVHEQFKDYNEEHCFVDVPKNISETEYKILIHQKKLDEGIDLPAAKISVLTYSVGSGRELVQTIGRVVRIFKDYPALVLDISNQEANTQLWNNYLEFDDYLSTPSSAKKFLQTLDTAELLKKYIKEFPEYSYFETGFRKKFNFTDFDPVSSLEIPLASVCFYKKAADFVLPSFMEVLNWNNEREGALSNFKILGEETEGVNYYITFNNSKFLRDTLFFQPSLEVTIVKVLDDIVAIFDSRGRDFTNKENSGLKGVIDGDTLFKMASEADKTITQQANTIALEKSNKRAESIALKGKNLEEINHSQSNSSYAITTTIISNLENDKVHSKYYLGVASGRISDQKKHKFSYQEFMEWLNNANLSLRKQNVVKSAFLNSYAQKSIEIPTEPPLACMLDFSDIEGEIKVKYFEEEVILENTFFYFLYDSGLNIFEPKNLFKFKPIPYLVTQNVNSNKQSFKFMQFKTFEKIFIEFNNEHELVLKSNQHYTFLINGQLSSDSDLINSKNLRLIFKNGITYFNDHFYKLQLPTQTGQMNQNIKKNIIGLPCLKREGLSEKGKQNSNNHYFDENSVFFEIDKMSNIHKGSNVPLNELGEFYRYLPGLDLMLLTDLGTEPADFIISSANKIVYVHVKCGNSSQRPASAAGALCEVGGQALKNIHNLITRTPRELANDRNLRNDWKLGGSYVLDSRIRLFNKIFNVHANLDNVLEVIKQRSSDPLVEKEIWVVAGNSFSLKYFLHQFDDISTMDEETMQAYQLLDAWFAQASNHNVNLKFFVSE